MSLSLILISALLLSYCLTQAIRVNAPYLRLVQSPNERSSHVQPTPSGGGLGFAIVGCWFGAVFINAGALQYQIILLSAIMAVLGLIDDVLQLSAAKRMLAQITVVALLIWWISPFPDLFIPHTLFLILLIPAGVWWLNLFNFMDGLDGFAATQALFMLCSVVGIVYCFSPNVAPEWIHWMLILTTCLIGFLILNFPPAKIFMGDSGSLYLAFMLLAFALVSLHEQWFPALSGMVMWLILGGIFIVDATTTLLLRMYRGERWTQAHRSHVYQKLSKRPDGSIGHWFVLKIALLINMVWLLPLATVSIQCPNYACLWLLIAYAPLILGAVYCDELRNCRIKKRKPEAHQ